MSRRNVVIAVIICVFVATLLSSHSAALSVSTSSVSFPNVFLNGYDQTVVGTTGTWQVDATDETDGWHVTIAATDFANASSDVLAVSNLEFRLLDENISLVSGDAILPFSTQTSFFSLSATPMKFLSATTGTANGVYDFHPDFRLTVPAESYVGNYSSTLTITVSSGP